MFNDGNFVPHIIISERKGMNNFRNHQILKKWKQITQKLHFR